MEKFTVLVETTTNMQIEVMAESEEKARGIVTSALLDPYETEYLSPTDYGDRTYYLDASPQTLAGCEEISGGEIQKVWRS